MSAPDLSSNELPHLICKGCGATAVGPLGNLTDIAPSAHCGNCPPWECEGPTAVRLLSPDLATGRDPVSARDDLRRVAEGATPGPWHPSTTGVEAGDHWSVIEYPAMQYVAHIPCNDGENEAQREPDARFIAAFDPPTVLALLDELDAKDAQLAAVRAVLAEGPDTWTPYDSRDTGETFLADSVRDFTAALRAVLGEAE